MSAAQKKEFAVFNPREAQEIKWSQQERIDELFVYAKKIATAAKKEKVSRDVALRQSWTNIGTYAWRLSSGEKFVSGMTQKFYGAYGDAAMDAVGVDAPEHKYKGFLLTPRGRLFVADFEGKIVDNCIGERVNHSNLRTKWNFPSGVEISGKIYENNPSPAAFVLESGLMSFVEKHDLASRILPAK